MKNLVKTFYTSGKRKEVVRAVDDLSFEVPSGKIFTLLGPSGSGKTTVLRCIAGLETPDSGEIVFAGSRTYSSEKKIFVPPEKRRVGMVFQTYAIWPHMTVFDNIAYPLQIAHMPNDQINSSVVRALELVQLQGFEQRSATKLSGGQQQRVALARALVYRPEILLLDEPLSNLDSKLRDEMRDELKHLLSDLNMTTVYVTHDQIEALAFSDVIAVMKRGRICQTDEPNLIYSKPKSRFVADFIGKTNLIEGTVTGTRDSFVFVKTPVGEIVCETYNEFDLGLNVTICLRPEFVEITPGRKIASAINTFEGKVESLLFAGETSDVWILSNNVRLRASLMSPPDVSEGNRIQFHVDPRNCHLIV